MAIPADPSLFCAGKRAREGSFGDFCGTRPPPGGLGAPRRPYAAAAAALGRAAAHLGGPSLRGWREARTQFASAKAA